RCARSDHGVHDHARAAAAVLRRDPARYRAADRGRRHPAGRHLVHAQGRPPPRAGPGRRAVAAGRLTMTDHAAGLDDLTSRPIAHSQEKLFGKYLGTVVDRNDPYQIGRLRLKVPSVFGDATTEWAWPASPFAGAGYGFLFVPKESDLVWVEFAEG